MNREKKLMKDTAIYAFGNLFSKLIGFILLPLYTSYLTVSDYGFWDIVTTTITLLIPIIIYQLNDALYRYLLDKIDFENKCKIITTAILIIIRNILFFISLYIFLAIFFDIKYKILILIQICISCIYEPCLQITRGLNKNILYAYAGIINTFITLSLNVLFIKYLNLGLTSLFLSGIIGASVTLIFIIFSTNIYKYIKLNYYSKELKKTLIKYSLPLIPNVVSWWIMNLSDRYIINITLGTEANGLYAISNKLPTIIFLFNSIFYLAWQESAILSYENHDRNEYYSKMFNTYMRFLLTSAILLLAFTKIVFKVMINTNFYEAINYIPFLYLGTVFSAFSSFYGTGYHSAKDTKGAFTTSIYGATVNILVNILFIHLIGIQAASISTMMAFLTMWLFRMRQTKKYFCIKIDKKIFFILLSIFTLNLLMYYSNNILIEIILIIQAMLVFVNFNKSIFYKIFKI